MPKWSECEVQDCKRTYMPKLLRFFLREDSVEARVRSVPRVCDVQATKEIVLDVVARKNAPQDNCMYVNDGVISLRLLRKKERERKRRQ